MAFYNPYTQAQPMGSSAMFADPRYSVSAAPTTPQQQQQHHLQLQLHLQQQQQHPHQHQQQQQQQQQHFYADPRAITPSQRQSPLQAETSSGQHSSAPHVHPDQQQQQQQQQQHFSSYGASFGSEAVSMPQPTSSPMVHMTGANMQPGMTQSTSYQSGMRANAALNQTTNPAFSATPSNFAAAPASASAYRPQATPPQQGSPARSLGPSPNQLSQQGLQQAPRPPPSQQLFQQQQHQMMQAQQQQILQHQQQQQQHQQHQQQQMQAQQAHQAQQVQHHHHHHHHQQQQQQQQQAQQQQYQHSAQSAQSMTAYSSEASQVRTPQARTPQSQAQSLPQSISASHARLQVTPPQSYASKPGLQKSLPPTTTKPESQRIGLLLRINAILLQEVALLQQSGRGGPTNTPRSAGGSAASGSALTSPTDSISEAGGMGSGAVNERRGFQSPEYLECMRRLQANLAYLAAIVERAHKSPTQIPACPVIMDAPASVPGNTIAEDSMRALRELYHELAQLFQEKGRRDSVGAGGGAPPPPLGLTGNKALGYSGAGMGAAAVGGNQNGDPNAHLAMGVFSPA